MTSFSACSQEVIQSKTLISQQNVQTITVMFTLKGNAGQDDGQVIQIFNNNHLLSSNFNANHPTRFRIHGWSQGGNRTGGLFRNAFLNRGEYNVIIVDWGAGAGTPNYVLGKLPI